MTKVGFVSLGCPKNLVDSEVMMGILEREGYELTPRADEAEVLVVNTCSFIEAAQKESVDAILEMAEHKKFGAAKKLIVAGCLVERYRAQILEQVPEVDAVIGTGEVARIMEAVEGELRVLPAQPPAFLYHDLTPRIVTTPKHAAYIKIAEGCDHPCTFCIIPQLRGAFRSRRSESRHAEIAGHHRGAPAPRQVHGHAAAARQPQRAGADETRFQRRRICEIAGAHSNDNSRRFTAHIVHRGLPGRNRSRFPGAVRFRKDRESRLDGGLRVFRRGQCGKLRPG